MLSYWNKLFCFVIKQAYVDEKSYNLQSYYPHLFRLIIL